MKAKFIFLLLFLLLTYSCQEEESKTLSYIQINVDGKSFKMDSVMAVYDDSAGVMSLIGTKRVSGTNQSLIAIGFKFSTAIQAPKIYDASRVPIELMAIYVDSVAVYSTALIDSIGNPVSPIGTGVLNLTTHNLLTYTIAGNFEFRPKEVDPQTWEPKTKTIYLKGSFQTYYIFLKRGVLPPIPLKVAPLR